MRMRRLEGIDISYTRVSVERGINGTELIAFPGRARGMYMV